MARVERRFDAARAARTRRTMSGARFRLVAKNSAGSTASSAAQLGVTITNPTAPIFETHPRYSAVAAGAVASFSAKASGKPAPSYQWQKSLDYGQTWTDIVGATGSSMEFSPAYDEHPLTVRVVASNSVGSAESDITYLHVCGTGPLTVTFDPTFWSYDQYANASGRLFCPRTTASVRQHPTNPEATEVFGLLETNLSSKQEAVTFSYITATGQILTAGYSLESATLLVSWLCASGSPTYRPCNNVVVDPAGQITFTNAVIGEEKGNGAVTLNGTLHFSPP